MRRKNLTDSIERIYATLDQEMDCEQLQSTLSAYVQFELTGSDPSEQFQTAQAHLLQCPDCLEDYKGLLAVARLDTQDRLPEAEALLEQFDPQPAPEGGAPVTIPPRRKS